MDVTARPPTGRTVVTVRLWDEQVAAAYRKSFAEFTRTHPDIDVRTNVVSYSTYFATLRTDVAGGSADDIFWVSNAYLAGYADSGRLLDIGKTLGPKAASAWEPSVVQQFTRGETLWAVPQLTDAGIAVYYNADLLAAAGVDAADLSTLRWSPDADDTLRPLLARLTVDADGHTAGTPGFDPARVRQWGYNAANDLQGIYLNYIGSAGGAYQTGDRFAFDNPACRRGLRLPGPADQRRPRRAARLGHQRQRRLLAQPVPGRQDGAFPVRHLQPGHHRRASQLPMGRRDAARRARGPGQRHQRHCRSGQFGIRPPRRRAPGIGVDGQRRGQPVPRPPRQRHPRRPRGPAVYFDYWLAKGVDVRPFFTVLDGPRIAAPGGAGFAAGIQALKPYFDEMFLGRTRCGATHCATRAGRRQRSRRR